MGGQPGTPSPPGNTPERPDPERPPPVEEPPLPIPPPPVEPPPAPMQGPRSDSYLAFARGLFKKERYSGAVGLSAIRMD
jgi:hypothetical protein